MTTEPRFVPWKGKEIMEEALPPGVRYRGPHDDTEWVALHGGLFMWADRHAVQTELDGTPIRRGDRRVTIIDWPDDCGPRPDAKPTWSDIIDNAPSPDAWTVFERKDGSRYHCPIVRGLARGDDAPGHTLIGYIDLGGRAQ